MQRDHRFVQAHLSDYLEGWLGRRRRRRVQRHVEVCPHCGPMVRVLLVLLAALRALGTDPPDPIAPHVIARLRSESNGHAKHKQAA
jgi:hypothetical protein